jgi:hypothetical protein
MLRSIVRAWSAYSRQTEIAALATRLGPHLARDIGIEEVATPRVLPALRPF